ncbi:MAG: DEAD/DEAH box helicase [Janthinobacterium lividum]
MPNSNQLVNDIDSFAPAASTPIDAFINLDLAVQALANPAEALAPAAEVQVISTAFAEMGLAPQIVAALVTSGYTEPTPVQRRAIPSALAGRDLLVSSPTGSGKTAAFMLPAIQKLGADPRPAGRPGEGAARRGPQPARPGLLVLTPTRELAMQVTVAAQTYGKQMRQLRTVSILGGVAYRQQLALLSKQPHILVATPGRLLDHIDRGRIDLSELKMLVLDEADRMLDMGFIDDIEAIIERTPVERQTLLFSATLDGKIGALARRFLKDPERIEITRQPELRAQIDQSILWVDDRSHKEKLLNHLLGDSALDQAIVFTATKLEADALSARLIDAGFPSAALHGDLPQAARNRTIRAVRDRKVRVLVATDVAARGIDIPGVTHVFNYDLPKFAEDYVHRIGRTGRAGRSGIAVSLVHHAELQAVKRIERFTHQTIAISVVAGLEPRRAPASAARGSRPRPSNDSSRGRSSGFGGRPGNGSAPGGRRPSSAGGRPSSPYGAKKTYS